MIGFSVGDILKLLDQIPVWKTLATLPKQVRELEARIAALEGRQAKPSRACPICGSDMKIESVEPDPTFAFAGVQRHNLACTACAHTEQRQVDPRKGK